MLHPVGHQNPSVYWRRRLALVAAIVALIALIVVTLHVVMSKNSGPSAAGSFTGSPSHTPAGSTSTTASSTPPASPTSHSASHTPSRTATGSASHSPSATASSTAPLLQCTAKQLAVAAVSSKPSYSVGEQLTLSMQVTNIGLVPCTQNLADSQVVLRVYNGESRVWGSHDCQIAPGTDMRTLALNQPVRISVVWSGRSSQVNCAGIRQQVGAGNYTLYASLSGKVGTAAQFAIK